MWDGEELSKNINFRLSQKQYNHCLRYGVISRYIRKLISDDIDRYNNGADDLKNKVAEILQEMDIGVVKKNIVRYENIENSNELEKHSEGCRSRCHKDKALGSGHEDIAESKINQSMLNLLNM